MNMLLDQNGNYWVEFIIFYIWVDSYIYVYICIMFEKIQFCLVLYFRSYEYIQCCRLLFLIFFLLTGFMID